MDLIFNTVVAVAMGFSGNESAQIAATDLATVLIEHGRAEAKRLLTWSADPNIRMEQMLYASPDLRQIREEWRKYWFTDMPTHLTPQRVHGGITP